jgi:hypothetical protein
MCVRGGRWFWRRRLPSRLAAPRGTGLGCEFRDCRLALKTSERAEARRRASLPDAEFERLNMDLQPGPGAAGSLGAALAAFPATVARGPALTFPTALPQKLLAFAKSLREGDQALLPQALAEEICWLLYGAPRVDAGGCDIA